MFLSYCHTWELFRLMNSALKLYAFLSDLILTRCWQIPPTPSGLGFPLHDRPNTRSSNTRLVKSTPKQNPSKLYLWYKECNIISNSLIAFGNSFYEYISKFGIMMLIYLENRFRKSSGIEYFPVNRLTLDSFDLNIVISDTVNPIHSEFPSSSKSSVWNNALAS